MLSLKNVNAWLEAREPEVIASWRKNLWSSSWVFLFILALQVIVDVKFIVDSYSRESFFFILASLLSSTMRSLLWAFFLWNIVALFRRTFFKKIVTILVLIVTTLVYIFESFLIAQYNTVYNVEIAQILAGTNAAETSEFLKTIPYGGMIGSFLWLIAVFILSFYLRAKLKGRDKKVGVITFISASFVFIGCNMYILPRAYNRIHEMGYMVDRLLSPFDRLSWNTYGFFVMTNSMNEGLERMKNFDVKIEKQANALDGVSIVVIVGETLRKDYMHCYGYSLPNTPKIDQMISQGDVTPFTDVISPGPSTVLSVTKTFTFLLNDEKDEEWYNYPSVLPVMSKGGYRVNWVSNQETQGVFMQPINMLAKMADKTFFPKFIRNGEVSNYDEIVFPHVEHLNDAKKNGKENLFQIIHLMGSHAEYNMRFPAKFAKYKTKDVTLNIEEDEKQIVADYINSIYYNDFIVSSLMKKYADEPSIVLYFSDHGEILYDDPSKQGYYGHGMLKQGVSIPLLMYLSPKFKEKYLELALRLQSYKDRRIMMDQLSHTLIDLAGLKTSYSDPANSFFSEHFNNNRVRKVYGFGKTLAL